MSSITPEALLDAHQQAQAEIPGTAEYYQECLKALLIGLECQMVDDFMVHASPVNCKNLGKMIADRAKAVVEKVRFEMDKMALTERFDGPVDDEPS